MRNLSLHEQIRVTGASDAIPITSAIAGTSGAAIGALIGTAVAGPIGAAIGSGIGAGLGTAIGIHAEDIGNAAATIPGMIHVRPKGTAGVQEISVSTSGTMSMDEARKIWPGI
jgi:uncharacterized membrane protein